MKEKIMLKFLKSLFGIESPTPVATHERIESAPYKVPEPAVTTPIPLVTATVAAPVAKPAAKPKAAAIKAPAKAPAAKAPAAKAKAPAKAPAAKAKAVPAKPKGPATKKPKISIAK